MMHNLYNVALFIDYENVYFNLLEDNRNTIRDGFFEKIREWCKKHGRRLVKIAVYCNYDNEDLHDSFHQSLLQSYGVESIHTSNQGKNFADLQITIDVLTAMHLNNNIDEFMIMSNDKDMTPLLNNIRYNKRKVSVVTVGDKYNDAICSFSDEQIKYEEIIQECIDNPFIETLEAKIVKNLVNGFDRYKASFNGIKSFQHTGLEYFVSKQIKSCNLMIYEVYNCLKNLADSGEILFYNYVYKGKKCIGICPNGAKEYLMTTHDVKEEDFLSVDLEKIVEEYYSKHKKS